MRENELASDAPELLAPAGNMECLHAAVCAGADAVYLGLDGFNARRNAGNFAVDGNFAEACEYAHLRGVKVYVTLNVEILPSELDSALNLARKAREAGADAFIVQDIGLATALRRELPTASLHASTQMNVHNAAGIAAAAQLGMSRVTLARELSVAEIAELAELAAEFGMTVECFVHGALCVCYSGQCLMSSMIGGRSANRGLCAQACRLPYDLLREGREDALPAAGEHLLSPRDLCGIDLVSDLAAAGVASFKVEGRMKSPDYVHEVVSVYREALDNAAPASEAQKARLAEAFSRGFTTAYLEGQRGNEIMSYGRPNNRGVFAGRVARVANDVAEIAPEIELHAGDVLEFWTNRGRFAAEVPADARLVGGLLRVPVDRKLGKGDRVFRVRNAQTAFADDAHEPRVPVEGSVELLLGQPAHVVFKALDKDGVEVVGEAWGDPVDKARTKPVTPQDVAVHVDRLGQTPFTLSGSGAEGSRLHIQLDEGIGIGFSQIHRLRTQALDRLRDGLLQAYADERYAAEVRVKQLARFTQDWDALEPCEDDVPADEVRVPAGRQSEGACQVMAWATNPGCARAAKRAGADAVYVPLLNFRRGQSQLGGVRCEEAEQAGYPKQCIMALPVVDHDPVSSYFGLSSGAAYPRTREYEQPFDPWEYVREGRRVFADSLAGATRALEVGAIVEVGPHVPVTNRASLGLLASWGVSRVWLSPELTLGQIADLAQGSPVPLGLFVSGAQELMVTEHCLLMSQGPCSQECETCPRRATGHRLVDRKGFEFPVVTDMMGRSHLYNGIELDAVPLMPDFAKMGISAVMVDTTLLSKKTTADAVGRALRARDMAPSGSGNQGLPKRRNTTTGHLHRGVS